jgi:hypothetical protein
MTSFFQYFSSEDKFDSLSYENLLEKASEIDAENKKMEEKIQQISKENSFLNNSIINSKNNKSEFSKFLLLMQNNLLNIKSSKNEKETTIDSFKKYLYNDDLMFGTLEENDISYLKSFDKNKLDWNNKKESHQLRQNILEKNLKELYSNMFSIMENQLNKKAKKIEHKKIIREEENKEVDEKEKEKQNNIIEKKEFNNNNPKIHNDDNNNKDNEKKKPIKLLNEKLYNMSSNYDFPGKKKEDDENLYNNLLNDSNNNDDEDEN